MSRRLHTLADGQLGSTAAAILSGTDSPPSRRVCVVCQNTGTSEETVVLTFQVGGGTARRLFRAVLNENEQLVADGLPIQEGDTLLGVTSTASTVDYLVSASGSGAIRFEVLDANGTGKGVTTLRKLLAGVQANLGDELPDLGG